LFRVVPARWSGGGRIAVAGLIGPAGHATLPGVDIAAQGGARARGEAGMDQHMTIRQEAPANRHAADLVAAARRALDRALADDGKLPEEVLSISGMSGRRYRRFVNHLV
jgi:hypothetical protein